MTFCLMQQPRTGNKVKPSNVTAQGTSSLQGMAQEVTTQQTWHCELIQLQPSFSNLTPTQPKGNKKGAPHLQQHSKLQQQIPALPLTPKASQAG
mmetsp:Transcript_20079/g.43216  ORF Transcript_20079/g.43216 Transcript_20079/m.43216 type:complete len:94 (+) Transcript_20079:232-513(+)|eukprot:CAMPEP_0168732230 /NCGR_PEP_ID=MMETSP0724-20121128/7667_1 /TAXON_ID=265536 /ORGANISM="Amphiprora sp., Strain CCMP467" /LENGTH=93 /DNA_ID=CAMNT_0008779249 /DNA_START=208 /DNA_END=489 /DNA_ORIENTATION=-